MSADIDNRAATAQPISVSRDKPSPILLSIIIPVYNEAETLVAFLQPLQSLRAQGCEIIVVDGGSRDDSVSLAAPWVDKVQCSDSGRARQMNCGAALASGNWLLFLHADTQLPDSLPALLQSLASQVSGWGFFPVVLSGRAKLFRVIERAISLRSRLSGVATGDQAMFVARSLFNRVNGFAPIALMEDVALSKQLRRHAKPQVWHQPVQTSSRRWERDGIVRTVLLMWSLRLGYCLGLSPERLVRVYYGKDKVKGDG